MAVSFAQSSHAEKLKGQTSLFGGEGNASIQYPDLPLLSPWKDSRALAYEKEILGFYVSGHPLNKFKEEVKTFSSTSLDALENFKDGTPVKVCGIVNESKNILDRKNKPMAFVTLEDFLGSAEVIVFSSVYEKYREFLADDSMILIVGRVSFREEEKPKIICEEIVLLDRVWEHCGKNLHLSVERIGADDPVLNQINILLKQNPGNCNLFFNVKTDENSKEIIKSKNVKVNPSPEVITQLRTLLGQNNVWMEA